HPSSSDFEFDESLHELRTENLVDLVSHRLHGGRFPLFGPPILTRPQLLLKRPEFNAGFLQISFDALQLSGQKILIIRHQNGSVLSEDFQFGAISQTVL